MKKHKNSQTTHPPDPPEPRSVVNNQSSIINRRVPYSPDPLMPLCPLVSCPRLLSRPFCRLCSCPLSLVFFHPLFLPALLVPLCPCLLCSSPLRAFVAISQLCKTNPISKTAKPPQPLMPQRLTPSFRSPPPPKNKPNQTQFITAKPAWGGPKPDPGPLLRSPRYASRFTRYDPFRFTLAVSAAGRRVRGSPALCSPSLWASGGCRRLP